MRSGIEGRLVRLERRGGDAWRSWLGTPLAQWPDAALVGFLSDATGIPRPPSTDAVATWLNDAQLVAIVREADGATVLALGEGSA